jgi:hypothetical protein
MTKEAADALERVLAYGNNAVKLMNPPGLAEDLRVLTLFLQEHRPPMSDPRLDALTPAERDAFDAFSRWSEWQDVVESDPRPESLASGAAYLCHPGVVPPCGCREAGCPHTPLFERDPVEIPGAPNWAVRLWRLHTHRGRLVVSAALLLVCFRELFFVHSLAAQELVLAERQKQRLKWGDKHDDEHKHGALPAVAAYLSAPGDYPVPEWAKFLAEKHLREKQLIVAVALILAEIDRIDRQSAPRREPRGTLGA